MANEKRLIDANVFKIFLEQVRQNYLEEDTCSSDFAAKVIETVQDEYLALAPTVDAVKVVHGRWEKKTEQYVYYYACSVCGEPVLKNGWGYDFFSHYCPNCGAKMDGDGNG